MHFWESILRFGDAHPWFLRSLAAVIALLTVAYKGTSWTGDAIKKARRRRLEKRVIGYLLKQLNPAPFAPDGYGHIPRRQKDCSGMEIAQALRKEPFKVRAILEELKKQHRVEQRGQHDLWCVANNELDVTVHNK